LSKIKWLSLIREKPEQSQGVLSQINAVRITSSEEWLIVSSVCPWCIALPGEICILEEVFRSRPKRSLLFLSSQAGRKANGGHAFDQGNLPNPLKKKITLQRLLSSFL
jgi:hypothetical protein